VISIHESIYSLVEIVKRKTDLATSLIQIYRDTSKAKSSILDENKTLENYGFTGGEFNTISKQSGDQKATLYFDFSILPHSDPILNSDYYFNSYKSYSKK
jgi:hypothetical protein